MSSSSHFALMLYSKTVKPVALPPGRARLFNVAAAHRVGGIHEDDRYRAGQLQQGSKGNRGGGQNGVRRERNQFRRIFTIVAEIAGGPADVHLDIASDDPALIPQALLKRGDAGDGFRIIRGQIHEYADAPHPLELLLRARVSRPRSGRASEQRDELAAFYPSHVKPKACTVKVRFVRSLAALGFSPDCQLPAPRSGGVVMTVASIDTPSTSAAHPVSIRLSIDLA